MTTTPRTDRKAWACGNANWVDREFARELETELISLKKCCKSLFSIAMAVRRGTIPSNTSSGWPAFDKYLNQTIEEFHRIGKDEK